MFIKGSELFAVVATIDPDAYTAAAYTSDWADASKFARFLANLNVGEMQATSTVDFKLQQATDSSGTGAKDITGYSATQLTAAGTDSDKQVLINLDTVALDVANGFTYVAMVMTVATAASDAGAVLWGLYPNEGVASDNDLASVDEIVK